MCESTIYPVVTQPGRTTPANHTEKRICLYMKQINEDIFPSSGRISSPSLFQHCSVAAKSFLLELPVAACWSQELLRQRGFNSQQIASQMFQTWRHSSDAAAPLNAPHNVTLEHLAHFWGITPGKWPPATLFSVDSRLLLRRNYNLSYDKTACIIAQTETNVSSQQQLPNTNTASTCWVP